MGLTVYFALIIHHHLTTTQKMLLLALILLLGCSSAFAAGNDNSMGCCKEKLVSGSGSKSGLYYLDTEASVEIFPDSCKDECLYVKESGPGMFCFKPSSMYTVQCKDTGTTIDIPGAGCRVEGNIAYNGSDIDSKPVTGVQACADFCFNTVGALYWTFHKDTSFCNVKSSIGNRISDPNAVSGNKACGKSDQFKGCCSWRNITGSAEKDGFYILSESGNDVTDQCMDGCAYTKVDENQEQHCLPATSMDDVLTECNSCNECTGTELATNIVGGCAEFAGKILELLAICTAECLLEFWNPGCIVGCIADKLRDAGLPAAAIDCICQVIPANLC